MTQNKAGRMALGRGLSSLISSPVVPLTPIRAESIGNAALKTNEFSNQNENSKSDSSGVTFINLSKIIPNPTQPRKTFIDSELKELSDSIKNLGVLQPVLVRPARGEEGSYEIVAGERRWRASQLAGIVQIPVLIKELSDWESLEIALVENVQRSQLDSIDEAQGYQRLMDQYSLSQQDVADRIGKDRATVANLLRILKLPADVQGFIKEGQISMGHGKALAGVKDSRAQLSLAKKAVEEGLSVRSLESIISQSAPLDGSKRAALKGSDLGITGAKRSMTSFPEIVEKMRRRLGTKVMIRHQKSGRGKIELDYFSEAELQRLVELLS
ncbi:MAG: ParB/RepB/Spo0J family partition protein [bacterium]|nr:ParB/RepB/Spo0J family partition protein [bacterium]